MIHVGAWSLAFSCPRAPEWWNIKDKKGATPFDLVLVLVCFSLGYAQVFTNRSLLDRAHREFAA
jgi:hypothetical protein